MSNETWPLQPGEQAYHPRFGRWGMVRHVSARRGAEALRHADGTERSYPVDALRTRSASTGEPTVRCRVEEQA